MFARFEKNIFTRTCSRF